MKLKNVIEKEKADGFYIKSNLGRTRYHKWNNQQNESYGHITLERDGEGGWSSHLIKCPEFDDDGKIKLPERKIRFIVKK